MDYNPERYDSIFHELNPYTMKILDIYWGNLKFAMEEQMLDIGCGPGNFTRNVLLPKVEKYLEHLVAVDISDKMIQVAKSTYSHPLISYKQLDFRKAIDEETKRYILPRCAANGGFHKIFSFYCLNFIQDQRQVAKNIFTLLKPGGEAFLVLIAKSMASEMVHGLSNIPKWRIYMEDAQEQTSYYQYIEDPVEEFKSQFESTGLKVNHCAYEHIQVPFNNVNDFIEFINGLNIYLDRIPEEYKEEFIFDALSVLKVQENQESARFECTVIISHVSKTKV